MQQKRVGELRAGRNHLAHQMALVSMPSTDRAPTITLQSPSQTSAPALKNGATGWQPQPQGITSMAAAVNVLRRMRNESVSSSYSIAEESLSPPPAPASRERSVEPKPSPSLLQTTASASSLLSASSGSRVAAATPANAGEQQQQQHAAGGGGGGTNNKWSRLSKALRRPPSGSPRHAERVSEPSSSAARSPSPQFVPPAASRDEERELKPLERSSDSLSVNCPSPSRSSLSPAARAAAAARGTSPRPQDKLRRPPPPTHSASADGDSNRSLLQIQSQSRAGKSFDAPQPPPQASPSSRANTLVVPSRHISAQNC